MNEEFSILDKGRDRKNTWLLGLLVFAAALAVRLALLSSLNQSPSFDVTMQKGSDTYRFFVWALQIAEKGDIIGHGVYNQSPLYPYFLALIFKITGGGNLIVPRLVQAFIGSFTAVIVFLLASRLKDRTAGVLAGLIIAFYGTLMMYDLALLRTSLLAFLNILFIYLLAAGRTAPSWRKGLLVGIVLGVALLGKPNILIMLPALVWWIVDARRVSHGKSRGPFSSEEKITWIPRPRAWRALVAGTVIGFAAIMAVLAARNIKAGASPFALSQRGALEFISGNHPEVYIYGWDIIPSVYEIESKADKSLFKSIPLVLSLYKDDPLGLVKRQLKKAKVLLNGFEAPNNMNYYIEKHYLSIMKVPWINWAVLLALAIPGMAFAWKKRNRYFELYSYVALYSLATLAFYVIARFRIPLVPALAVFAGVGLESMYELARSKKWKALVPVIVVVVGVALLLWPRPKEPLGPNDYHNLVRYHLLKEEPEKARQWYEKGLEHSRQLVKEEGDARSHYLVARMLFLGGRPLHVVKERLDKASALAEGPSLKTIIKRFYKAIEERQKGRDPHQRGYRLSGT